MDLVETGNSKARHPWELARIKAVKSILSRTSKLKNGRKVLDIGSGDGYIAATVFNTTNSNCITGIDIEYTDKIINELNNLYPGIRWCRDYSELNGEKYDTIMMFDLLEHIDDPKVFMKLLNDKYLTDSGMIFIVVPAFQLLFSNHDRFVKHERRYNRRQLLKLISESGLECMASGYYGFSLLFLRSIIVSFEKLLSKNNKQHGVGAWKYGKMITKVLEFIINIDNFICFFLQRIKCYIPGLTAWAICRKPQ